MKVMVSSSLLLLLAAAAVPAVHAIWDHAGGEKSLLRSNNNNKNNNKNDQDIPIPPGTIECLKHPDEASCNSAVDEDGNSCDWCNTAAAIGLCMSQQEAQAAKQFAPLFQCDDVLLEDEEEEPLEVSPNLLDCIPYGDEDQCNSAVDADGNACDWCDTSFGVGACLSSDVVDKANQLKPFVNCDTTATTATTAVSSDPDPHLLDCWPNFDQASCVAAVDQDKKPCHWCDTEFNTSICIPDEVEKMIEQFQPYVTCHSSSSSSSMVIAKEQEEEEQQQQVRDIPPTLLDCLPNMDKDSCEAAVDEDGNACDWCDTTFGVGACVSSDVVDELNQFQPFVTCDSSSVAAKDIPPTLLDCLPNMDKDSCEAAIDEDGNACDWCDTTFGVGACVSSDVVDELNQFQPFVTCDDSSNAVVAEKDIPPTLLDCLPNMDKDSCEAAIDEDGNACDWCDTTFGVGACVSSDVVDELNQFQPFVTCDDSSVAAKDIPPTLLDCLPNMDKDSCEAAIDEDGNACDWCDTTFGVGACVSSDVVDELNQFQPFVTCDDSSSVAAKDIPPTLLDCLPNMDKDSCEAAIDEDGNACDWCDTTFGVGACVSSDVVDIANQFQPFVTCDATFASLAIDAKKETQPKDVPPTLLDCLPNMDEDSCTGAVDEDGNACDWCSTTFGFGACVSSDVVDIAHQFEPFVTCGGDDKEKEVSSPKDPVCYLAGAHGGENACDGAQDMDHAPCVWCSFPTDGNQGICLNQDQANFAQNYLQCDYLVMDVAQE